MLDLPLMCGVLSAVLLVIGRAVQRRIKRARVYGRRDDLSLPAIWRRHFAILGLDEARCTEEWLQLAQTFHVAPGKLRVTDRFDRELRNLDHLLDGWLLLTVAAAQADDQNLRPFEIETVRDFVMISAGVQMQSGLVHRT